VQHQCRRTILYFSKGREYTADADKLPILACWPTLLNFLLDALTFGSLVIKQMGELGEDRRCWQQIGPVLAEKKVKDVLPILSDNREQVSIELVEFQTLEHFLTFY
jgi:Prefoldin subunit